MPKTTTRNTQQLREIWAGLFQPLVGRTIKSVRWMDDHKWVKDAYVFLTGLLVIQYLLKLLKSPMKEMDESYRSGDHPPEWVDNLAYLLLALTLAALGHWALAICWVIIGSADLNCRRKALENK